MFRLIKLALYGLIGYAIYEFVRGMTEEQGQGGGQPTGGSRELNRALERDAGRTNVSGAGQGHRVTTEDSSGQSAPHTVGRGVIS